MGCYIPDDLWPTSEGEEFTTFIRLQITWPVDENEIAAPPVKRSEAIAAIVIWVAIAGLCVWFALSLVRMDPMPM